jgi:hypothetical protein
MPVNVGNFGSSINIWAKKTKANMTKFIQNTYRGIAEEIITTAPCDTGAYIGGWTPSLNAPQTSNDFVPGPSQYRGRTIYKGAMSSVNRMRAIAHVRKKLDMIIPLVVSSYGSFYFTNGVRHARYVEYGGGATPPYAVVRRAMLKYRRTLTTTATFGTGTGSNVARSAGSL